MDEDGEGDGEDEEGNDGRWRVEGGLTVRPCREELMPDLSQHACDPELVHSDIYLIRYFMEELRHTLAVVTPPNYLP